MTRTPHKHAELIKAWADGARVQVCHGSNWFDCGSPEWNIEDEYRIKPEPKPDYTSQQNLSYFNANGEFLGKLFPVLVTYSGETGEPIKMEIYK